MAARKKKVATDGETHGIDNDGEPVGTVEAVPNFVGEDEDDGA